jgi:hypothetical protein
VSRAGRQALATDRARVNKLVADAAARFKAQANAEALTSLEPDGRLTGVQDHPEVPPEVLLQVRCAQLHNRCHRLLVGRYPSLWHGETIGAAIAEQWIQNLMRRASEQVVVPA